jgi:hypothetical protein
MRLNKGLGNKKQTVKNKLIPNNEYVIALKTFSFLGMGFIHSLKNNGGVMLTIIPNTLTLLPDNPI